MNIEELGRRAVACKHWKWMPGMYLLPHVDGCECCKDRDFPRRAARLPSVFTTDIDVPDLRDPATLGCLLHLVREATGQQSSPSWYPGGKHDYPHWAWYSDNCYGKLCEGATEAECLVRVLEFTP